jgi:hypothetical protein
MCAGRGLLLQGGVEFDDKGTALYDHFSHQAAGGASDPTLVATSHIVESKAIFGDQQPKVRSGGGGDHLLVLLGGGAQGERAGQSRRHMAAKIPQDVASLQFLACIVCCAVLCCAARVMGQEVAS